MREDHRVLRGSFVLALCLIAGCSATPATQLIVVVDTDIAVPGALDTIDILVTRPDATMAHEHQAVGAHTAFPLTLTVVADHDVLGPISIVATGSLGATEVVSREAAVTLVRHETRVVTMYLVQACIGMTCPAAETCTEIGCVARSITNPPSWTGNPPSLHGDAGVQGDGGALDAGCTSDGECDDAMYCNGLEHCVSGVCTHPGNPCTGNTTCDETMDACRGCTTRSDCPADDVGTFGACDYVDVCDTTAMHVRTNTIYACTNGACTSTPMTVSQPCTRTTDGTMCGATTCGTYGSCAASDPCVPSGTATRTCMDLACAGGACMPTSRPDTMPCTRTTDGDSCGTSGCGAWGACSYGSTCATGGTRHRTCMDPMCASGSCAANMRTEDDTSGCMRATDGTSCGTNMTCTGGACASCLPTISGSLGTTYAQKAVTGSGHTLTFTDANSAMGSITASSAVTFSGGGTATTVAFTAVHASGNMIHFLDWSGNAFTVTVTGATVSGDFVAPCIPFMSGCLPGPITQITTSGNVITFHSSTTATGTVTLGCP